MAAIRNPTHPACRVIAVTRDARLAPARIDGFRDSPDRERC